MGLPQIMKAANGQPSTYCKHLEANKVEIYPKAMQCHELAGHENG